MKPPFPSLTPTWHNASYASIQPDRPELSAEGKTVVVTGAGSGIGRSIAVAFAVAGAQKIALLGRSAATLQETRSVISPKTATSIHPANVCDEKALNEAATQIEQWDILVINAGFLPTPGPLKDCDTDDWWRGFETNVKGSMLTTKAFLPIAANDRPVILGLSTGSVCLPPDIQKGSSSYTVSKLAQIMLLDFVRAENPYCFIASFHPGVVLTDMTRKAGNADGSLPTDDIAMAAHFAVWLSSQEASFLNGKFVWANWDVDELKAQAVEIEGNPILTANILGWPHPHVS